MSKQFIRFAELHKPLFLGGKSFGMKLDPGKLAGLGLVYEEEKKKLFVYWDNRVGMIPDSNIAVMEEGEPVLPRKQITHPMVANLKGAQVETPQSHVHAGFGAGKTGKSKEPII